MCFVAPIARNRAAAFTVALKNPEYANAAQADQVTYYRASKIVVGTQLGILSIFNRSSGWGDCVDRIPGFVRSFISRCFHKLTSWDSHPMSVDTLCALPPDLGNVDTESTILTGSSDGLLRAVQILPTKLLGVVADHGEWPIERISIGGGRGQLTLESVETDEDERASKKVGSNPIETNTNVSQRRWWVGSVGHDEVLRMTDLEGFFRDKEDGEDDQGDLGVGLLDKDSDVEDGGQDSQDAAIAADAKEINDVLEDDDDENEDEDEEEEISQPKIRKRKAEQEPIVASKKKKGRNNTVTVEKSFFDEL